MNKNQANQYLPFFAYDTVNQIPFLGGTLANFTVSRSLNGAPDAACTAPTITETGGGYYAVLLTSAGDTNGDVAVFTVAYSGPQPGISIDPIPIYQMFPVNFCTLGITGGGKIAEVATTDQLSGDVAGKVLGGGASTILATGAWSLDGSGNAPATASALATLQTAATNLNNLSALANLFYPTSMVRPSSGSIAYPLTFVVKDSEGHSIDVDSNTVTLTATNAAGTDRSANLSAATHSATGEYIFTYTVASSAVDEGLRITAAGTVQSAARKAYANIDVADADSLLSLAAIQAQTDKLAFDGSNNVKSTPQTSVTVATNNDKTGYSLSGAAVTAVQSGLATAAALASLVAQFTGITSMANWLRAAFRNSSPDSTALTEINSAGGSYAANADSLQAIAASAGSGGSGSLTTDEIVEALTTAGLPITILSSVLPTGQIRITQGDDYNASETPNRALPFPLPASVYGDLSEGASVQFVAVKAGGNKIGPIDGTIANGNTEQQAAQIELQSTDTDSVKASDSELDTYSYSCRITKSTGKVTTFRGPLILDANLFA
jgi:hypothetical protein